jgi:hypothetical protein
MTNKIKNQKGRNLQKNQSGKSFSIPEVMDFRSLKAAFIALNSIEPEPLFYNGKYLYV